MAGSKPKYTFDLEFQREVIHLALKNGTFLRETRGALGWEYFTDPIHQVLVDHTLEYFDTYGRPPSKGALLEVVKGTVKDNSTITLAGVRKEVDKVLAVTNVSASYVGGAVREFAANSAAVALIAEFEDYAERGLQEEWFKEVDKALAIRHPEPAMVPHEQGIVDRLKSYKQGFTKANPVTTGLRKLDTLLLGGLGSGELGILMGLVGAGKSHCMVHLGAAAAEAGCLVYHFSLEMGRPTMLRRYDQRLARLTDTQIAKKAPSVAKKIRKQNLLLAAYPSRKLSPSNLRSVLSRKGPPDLLIVDYGAIMQPERRSDKRFEQEEIYAALRELAIEFSCAVWSPIQVHRAGYNSQHSAGDHLGMENVAEAFAVCTHGDVVISFNQTIDEMDEGSARLWVDKNREAPSKQSLEVKVDWSRSLIEDSK